MELPDPWLRYAPGDWPRLAKAIRRLNSLRRRNGLAMVDPRPPTLAPRLRPTKVKYGHACISGRAEEAEQ
jgi:hypothetical protein